MKSKLQYSDKDLRVSIIHLLCNLVRDMTNEEVIETKIYCRNGEVVFSITEHHKWGENDRNHLAAILKEIRAYIANFISGEIYSDYPEAKSKARVIEIVGKYPLNTEANRIFGLLGESSGFTYRFRLKGS